MCLGMINATVHTSTQRQPVVTPTLLPLCSHEVCDLESAI